MVCLLCCGLCVMSVKMVSTRETMCLLWPVGDVSKDGKYKGDSVSTVLWPVCDVSKDGKYKGDNVSIVACG